MAGFDSGEDVVARVKEQADIVRIIGEHVSLKKSGARYLGCCPFHSEKTPSFSVHPAKQFYYCFGCGESGDVFSFLMKYNNLDFPAALKELARRYGIQLPDRPLSKEQSRRASLRKQMLELNARVAAIYRNTLLSSSIGQPARRYLTRRGLSEKIGERFQIGYAPGVEQSGWNFLGNQLSTGERNLAEKLGLLVKKEKGGFYDRFRDRVMFPIMDASGGVIGFGGRIVGDGQPKYMNSPESPLFNKSRSLFGQYQTRDACRQKKQAILVEGNFDLISLVDAGLENVVAPLGTAVTREQLALLKRSCTEGVLLFDGDAAGIKAAFRSASLFLAEELNGRVALLPAGHDPDSYVREFGVQECKELIHKASPLPEFVFEQLVKEFGLTLDGKRAIVAELQPLINSAASPLQRSVVLSHFAEKLGLPLEDLKEIVKTQQKTKPFSDDTQKQADRLQPVSPAQKRLIQFMVLNPMSFHELEESGIRECLSGTVGEILFLQLRKGLAENPKLQPEDLLTLLPAGAERGMVADLLVNAAKKTVAAAAVSVKDSEAERTELLEWIRCEALKKRSTALASQIQKVQGEGDFQRLQELIAKKVDVDKQLQNLQDETH